MYEKQATPVVSFAKQVFFESRDGFLYWGRNRATVTEMVVQMKFLEEE